MGNFIDHVFAERRSLQEAVAELRARYARNPAPDLARMIRQGEAEILDRAKGYSSVATGHVTVTAREKQDRRKRPARD